MPGPLRGTMRQLPNVALLLAGAWVSAQVPLPRPTQQVIQPVMLGEGRNAAAQDMPPEPVASGGDSEPAMNSIRDYESNAAKDFLFRRSVKRNAAGSTAGEKIDLFDAKTGMPLDALDSLNDMAKDEKPITEDEFGPIGPGRRERLARMAGLTDQQARELWPLDEPGPVTPSAMAKAIQVLTKDGGTMEEAIAKLAPDQSRERAQALKNTVLTDAEASFAVYAALGFPYPIRTGKVKNPPPNGFVVFNPQLLRVDLTNEKFKPRHITYRWMEGGQEVYSAEAEVMTYFHLPRPTAPATHVLISSDDDVMVYALVGMTPPNGLWDVRSTLMKDVVDMYSHLRPETKVYGLRWTLLPSINEITDNPQTKAKMTFIMEDLGFIKPGQAPPVIKGQALAKAGEFGGEE